jgi:hypothetical protein
MGAWAFLIFGLYGLGDCSFGGWERGLWCLAGVVRGVGEWAGGEVGGEGVERSTI